MSPPTPLHLNRSLWAARPEDPGPADCELPQSEALTVSD